MAKNVDKVLKSENEHAVTEEARKALEEERDQKIKTIRDLQVNCLHYEQSYNCIYLQQSILSKVIWHVLLSNVIFMCRVKRTGWLPACRS